MATDLIDSPTRSDTEFHRIVDGLTRRGFLTGAAGSAAILALAGCGGNDETTKPTSASGATIPHEHGSTTVPPNPQRVVTVGYNDQDFVLALGVVPIATRGWFENYNQLPWVQKATQGKGVRDTAGSDEINYEAIAAAGPDLILALYEDIDSLAYRRLSAIAPTVVKGAKFPADEIPWREELRLTAEALGKQDQAKDLLAQVEAKITAAKEAHPEFAGKVLVVDYGPEDGGHWLVPAGDPRRALFDDLGFAAQKVSEDISEEQVDLLDRDILFVQGATRKQMLTSSPFSHLDVVSEQRTLYAGFSSTLSAALSYDGPQALLYALDVLVPQLANVLNGRPVANLESA
jgi:iron complex transport system substrate-binding protein